MRNYLSKSESHCSCWCYCRFCNLNAGGLGLVMPWGWGWNLTDHIPFVYMLCIVRDIRQLFFDPCFLFLPLGNFGVHFPTLVMGLPSTTYLRNTAFNDNIIITTTTTIKDRGRILLPRSIGHHRTTGRKIEGY